MWLIDVILNLAALLLWLKWRETKSPQMELPGISLVATLKRPTASSRQPILLVILLGLLLGRWLLYWQLGSALNWTPRISLGVISIPFRSDFSHRILVYSFLSFAVTLGMYYLTLIFFAIVNGRKLDHDPLQRVINDQFGWLAGLPAPLKFFFAWFLVAGLWIPLSWLLAKIGVIPAAGSVWHAAEQGAVIGLAVFASWKYVAAAVLLLYLLNSYIYFGNSPLWNFVQLTGRRLAGWLPLRIGKIDFSSIVVAAVVILIAEWALRWLVLVYQRLPF